MPIDIFDEVSLSATDKIAISDEFKKVVHEEVLDQIKKIPLNDIITKGIEAKTGKINDELREKDDVFDETIREEIKKTKEKLEEIKLVLPELSKTISSLKKEIDAKVSSSLPPMHISISELKKKFQLQETTQAERKSEESDFRDKMRKKYDDLMTRLLNQPTYQGGPKANISSQTYTTSNVTTARTLNATNTSLDELASFVGSLIVDLQSAGILK